jgi:hypothetical protein
MVAFQIKEDKTVQHVPLLMASQEAFRKCKRQARKTMRRTLNSN